MPKTKKSLIGKISPMGLVSDSYQELKKVTWPSRQQIIKLSTIVVGASIITGIYLGALDYLFTYLLGFILHR